MKKIFFLFREGRSLFFEIFQINENKIFRLLTFYLVLYFDVDSTKSEIYRFSVSSQANKNEI